MKFKLTIDCPQKWSSMSGDEKIRHCGMCKKDIHNLEEYSEEEAQAIIAEGTNCVRMEANHRGQIKTISGFSKSLLLMSLAMGCGDAADTKTTESNSTQVEEPRPILIGEVEEGEPLNPGMDSNTKSIEEKEVDKGRPHKVGRVRPKKEEQKELPKKEKKSKESE